MKLNEIRGRDSGKIECIAITDVEIKKASVQLLVKGNFFKQLEKTKIFDKIFKICFIFLKK